MVVRRRVMLMVRRRIRGYIIHRRRITIVIKQLKTHTNSNGITNRKEDRWKQKT